MCDQYDNRGCEVVDELTNVISDLEMTIADLKQEIAKLTYTTISTYPYEGD